MSCVPGILPFSRRSKRNPYADRGLAEFARVAADLEAKRKKLLIELGTQLSAVRFSSGSGHSNWVPIIICPSLSTDEVRALRQAATNLISEDASSAGKEKYTHSDNAERGLLTKHDVSNAQIYPSGINTGRDSLVGGLAHVVSSAEKFLWMAAFGLSVVADIIRSFFMLRPQPVMPSKRRPKSSVQATFSKHNASALAMASNAHAPSLSPPAETAPSASKPAPLQIRRKSPPHPLHVKASKTDIKGKRAGSSTAPTTPTHSRQVKKPFLASTVSFPETREDTGISKEKQLCTTVSLPKTVKVRESDLDTGSSCSTANKRESCKGNKEELWKWDQAVTGVGLALGLSGLVMGYVPAVVSVVCWWYLLPNLGKAVGEDKPSISSQLCNKRA